MAASQEDVIDRTIIVAVDLGTTFTGICWTTTDNLGTIYIIKVWPAAGGPYETLSTEKVPSRIVYDASTNKVIAWGAMVGNQQQRYQEFKLLLDPDHRKNKAKLEQLYPDPSSLPFTPQNSPTRCIIDYLKHVLPILQANVDAKAGPGTFDNANIEWVITVPAIWSDSARRLTAFCAEQAGMTSSPKLITEPEAAMIHAIGKMKGAGTELKVGDTFTLCDAGGGTVDLITYKITCSEPIQLEEVVSGDGDRCGSIYIDRQFKRYIKKFCEPLKHWTEKHTTAAVDYFERVTKRKFEEKDEEAVVRVPKIPDTDKKNVTIRKNKWIIPAADIRYMFQNVLEVVYHLIQEQIRKAAMVRIQVTGVILVGGFGQSKYVEEYVKNRLYWHDKHMIVVQPPDAWTAVMQGALNRALPILREDPARVQVSSRVARRFYGITYSRAFRAGSDPDDKKYWVKIEKWYHIETIHWFLKKGLKVKENYELRRDYIHSWPAHSEDPKDSTIYLRIFSWDGPAEENPPAYPSSEGVEKVNDLNVNLSVLPRGELRGYVCDGVMHHFSLLR